MLAAEAQQERTPERNRERGRKGLTDQHDHREQMDEQGEANYGIITADSIVDIQRPPAMGVFCSLKPFDM